MWVKPYVQQHFSPQGNRFLDTTKICCPKVIQITSKYHVLKNKTQKNLQKLGSLGCELPVETLKKDIQIALENFESLRNPTPKMEKKL